MKCFRPFLFGLFVLLSCQIQAQTPQYAQNILQDYTGGIPKDHLGLIDATSKNAFEETGVRFAFFSHFYLSCQEIQDDHPELKKKPTLLIYFKPNSTICKDNEGREKATVKVKWLHTENVKTCFANQNAMNTLATNLQNELTPILQNKTQNDRFKAGIQLCISAIKKIHWECQAGEDPLKDIVLKETKEFLTFDLEAEGENQKDKGFYLPDNLQDKYGGSAKKIFCIAPNGQLVGIPANARLRFTGLVNGFPIHQRGVATGVLLGYNQTVSSYSLPKGELFNAERLPKLQTFRGFKVPGGTATIPSDLATGEYAQILVGKPMDNCRVKVYAVTYKNYQKYEYDLERQKQLLDDLNQLELVEDKSIPQYIVNICQEELKVNRPCEKTVALARFAKEYELYQTDEFVKKAIDQNPCNYLHLLDKDKEETAQARKKLVEQIEQMVESANPSDLNIHPALFASSMVASALLLPEAALAQILRLLAQKSTEFVVGATIDGFFQLALMQFADSTAHLSWEDQIKKLDAHQMALSGAEAMVNHMAFSAIFSCLRDALFEGGKLKTGITWSSFGADCILGACASLTVDFLLKSPELKKRLDQFIGLAKTNPTKMLNFLQKKFHISEKTANLALHWVLRISEQQANFWVKCHKFGGYLKQQGDNIIIYAHKNGKQLAKMAKDGKMEVDNWIDNLDLGIIDQHFFGKYQLAGFPEPQDIYLITSKKDPNKKDGILQIFGFGKGGGGKIRGKIDKSIKSVAPYLDELKNYGVSVKKMTKPELNELLKIKRNNQIGDNVNIAKAKITMKNSSSYSRYATSGFPDKRTKNILTKPKGANIPVRGNSIFLPHTSKWGGRNRVNDTEVKLLEEFALKNGAKPNVSNQVLDNVEGKIKLYTQLCPCGSCANVIKEFTKMFPKVKLEIITNPKKSFVE